MITRPNMTPADFRKVIGFLKRAFSQSQHKKEVLADAQDPNKFGPRGGKMYKCGKCDGSFPMKDVQVDHVEPVIPLHTPALDMSTDVILSRLWCDKDNLMVLCKKCHDIKSKEENECRREFKKLKKEKSK
jgi:5-methylcytosine-specific restriction endonuclease McrA